MDIQVQGRFYSHSQSRYVKDTSYELAMNEFYQRKLAQIKGYSSEFNLIHKAIKEIPENSHNAVRALVIFNKTIANYAFIKPFPVISCLQEIQKLEKQLEDYFLEKLWDVLWCHALVDIADKPQIETIEQKREWFKDNQSLLDEVTALELQGSNIVRLPKEIFLFRNLKRLDLSENLLEELPEAIKFWRNLEELNLSCNELRYLSSNGIRYLKKLRDVNISANRLTSLPRFIKNLKKLKKLNIEENDITEIPREIGKCTVLEVLNVSSNELSELCVEMMHLTSLKVFSVADNELKTLPAELGNWKKIKKVDLSYNLLKGITEGFIKALWPSITQISL